MRNFKMKICGHFQNQTQTPSKQQLAGWHLRQNLEHKLRESAYNQANITAADIDLKWLLMSPSEEEYDTRKEQLKTAGNTYWKYDDGMVQYFETK